MPKFIPNHIPIPNGTRELKSVGFDIINLGGDELHNLMDVLHMIEDKLNKEAKVVYEPFHPADMMATWADITKAKNMLNWQPITKIDKGIFYAIKWYKINRSWAAKIEL
jgi:UDP-glucuronate 4-epimerase